MEISQRIIWIFSNSYILRKNSFLHRRPKFLLVSPIIFLFGLIRIIQYFLLQKSTETNIPNHLVIVTAAPHMHMNYFRLFNNNFDASKYLLIDSLNKKKFTQIMKLNFLDIFAEFFLTFKELVPILSRLNINERKNIKLYEATLSLPVFAYFTCLFKCIRMQNPESKIFSGGTNLVSAAGTTASIPVLWLAHGLIGPAKAYQKNIAFNPSRYFIALPKFQSIYLYSDDEIKYLRDYGIESQLCLYNYEKIDKFNKKIIIFLDAEDRFMNFEDLSNLIDWFKKYKYSLIVKFHPSYMGSLDKKFFKDREVRIAENHGASALKLMLEEKPMFVCGWLSTTLCEAFRLKIIPICLTSKKTDSIDLLHNFKQKSIFWDNEKNLLENCMTNNKDPFALFQKEKTKF